MKCLPFFAYSTLQTVLSRLFDSGSLFINFSEKSKKELTKHTVFTEYLKEEEQEEENLKSELYFDASYFKANRMVRK